MLLYFSTPPRKNEKNRRIDRVTIGVSFSWWNGVKPWLLCIDATSMIRLLGLGDLLEPGCARGDSRLPGMYGYPPGRLNAYPRIGFWVLYRPALSNTLDDDFPRPHQSFQYIIQKDQALPAGLRFFDLAFTLPLVVVTSERWRLAPERHQ
ncbi:hypothetical protein CC2G_014687 [Coprinopsis cinerea AmutBmut pab1-1]|nr:hypothetical protein CC2G_014687 [Coprinopsis cinerea AmutBmut pab1-1]